MALIEPVKNGGRYTKREQEERRLQVHHLHFEDNKSAVEIAETLNVNRNTINEDIKFWFRQIPNKTNILDIYSGMIEEIQRKKIQRDRLLDYLEEVDTINEKIRLEKLICDIGNRLEQFFSKLIFSGKENLSPADLNEIDEIEIKEFVRYLIFLNIDPNYYYYNYTKEFLMFEFIKKTKCDVAHSGKLIQKMKDYGLRLCEVSGHMGFTYDLQKFAELRGYLSRKEIEEIEKQREIQIEEEEEDDKYDDNGRYIKKRWLD